MADKPKANTGLENLEQQVGVWLYIAVVTIYYIFLGIVLTVGLVALWPNTSAPSDTSEVQMILIVIIAGALGSLIHGFRSLFWYVGNRAYTKSWTLMYILLPFVGSSLSLVFYFVLRGGLFSSQSSIEATSPFGFAGISGLVGMFSNKAALKLQEVADSLFSTQQSTKGRDDADKKIEAETKIEEKDKGRK